MTQRPSNRHAHSEHNDGIFEANHVTSFDSKHGEASADNIENNIPAFKLDPSDIDLDIDWKHEDGMPIASDDSISGEGRDSADDLDESGHTADTTPEASINLSDDHVSDGYASDDSCASHDSYDTNFSRRKSYPPRGYCHPRSYYFPARNTSTHKNGEDGPSWLVNNHTRVTQTPVSLSRLEKLPAELRKEILSSMPDLVTLRSVVHASPIMYAQYRYDRHKILATCLEREFEGFYVDAYANLKSRVSELGILRNPTDFVRSYQGWLMATGPYLDAKSLPPSRVRWMVAYHTSIARPLVRRYSSWALANLGKGLDPQNDTPSDRQDSGLSRSEEIRIFRALYRHEISTISLVTI